MTSHALRHQARLPIPRPDVGIAGIVCIGGLVLLGVGALAGGIALVAAPDGSAMHFSTALLAGSPFPDYLVPGLILGGLFGVGSLVVAAMGLRRHRLAPFLAFGIGTGQMIWIVVELAIIDELSFLHPVMFIVGVMIAASAVPWGRPTFIAWRSRDA
jgi:hypothetical protein